MGTLIGAAGVAYVGSKIGQVDTYDIDLSDVASGAAENYLIVGSDSRDAVSAQDPNADVLLGGSPGGRRSDTILVARIDPAKEQAIMLSLPRDLWVPIAGGERSQRINVAYGMGKQVLVDTVQQYLGLPINHYIEVDFRGFQSLVDAIGGVPMYFDRAFRDARSGLDVLHPGCTTLDGSAALAFARSRQLEYMQRGRWRSDPTGDLGRISRQQLFVRRSISRASSRGLSNPLTLRRLVDVGVENVGIDKGLSVRDLLALGRRFQGFGGDELQTFTLPVASFTTDGGADVLRLDEAASVPTLDRFRDQRGEVPGSGASNPGAARTEAAVSVRVLNASGVAKRAANVAGALQATGFVIAGLGNVDEIGGSVADRSEIRHAPGDGALANLLARHLAGGVSASEDERLRSGSIVLLAGRSLTAVEAEPRAEPRGSDRVGDRSTTTVAPTVSSSTTEPIGRTPGEPPPGTNC